LFHTVKPAVAALFSPMSAMRVITEIETTAQWWHIDIFQRTHPPVIMAAISAFPFHWFTSHNIFSEK
jgi:hypothetical protein